MTNDKQEFEREERYIALKLKDLTHKEEMFLRDWIFANSLRTRECVVVEADWPIYEQVWGLVEQLATGQPQQAQGEAAPSLYRCSKCGAEAWANDTGPELTCNMGCGLSPAYRVSPVPATVPEHPSFESAEALALWLEDLHATTPDGAICANKWEPAQIAAGAVRGQSYPPAPAAVPEDWESRITVAAQLIRGEALTLSQGHPHREHLEASARSIEALTSVPAPAEPEAADKPDRIQTCPHCLYVHELQLGNDRGMPAEPERELEAVPNMDWLKEFCTSFFYWWYNQPGANTRQGFDGWLETENAAILLERLAGHTLDELEATPKPERETVDLVATMAGVLDSAARVGRLNPADTIMIGDDIFTLSQILDSANHWLGEHNSVDLDEQHTAAHDKDGDPIDTKTRGQ